MCVCVLICAHTFIDIHTQRYTHANKHIYINCCHTSSAALTILTNDNSLIAFEPGMWVFFLLLIPYFWLSQFIRCVQKLYFLHVVGTLAAQFPAV